MQSLKPIYWIDNFLLIIKVLHTTWTVFSSTQCCSILYVCDQITQGL